MNTETLYLIYIIIGLSYWTINIFIRKLHKLNEPEMGWYLSLMWFLLWPICFIALISEYFLKIKENKF